MASSTEELELEDFRLMDAAETLVNLHSVQAARASVMSADDHTPSHIHHHRPINRSSDTLLMESASSSSQSSHQTQSIVDPSGTGVIFISTTPPSTSSTLHISPLNSPVLHHLTNVAPSNFDPTDLEKSPSAAVASHLALEALSPSDAQSSLRNLLHHDPNMAELDLSPAHRQQQRSTPTLQSSSGTVINEDPFDLSLNAVHNDTHVPMGPPPLPPLKPSTAMMRPPPPPKRGRGSRRGAERGAPRGRGRGRGRGLKAGPQTDEGGAHIPEQMEVKTTTNALSEEHLVYNSTSQESMDVSSGNDEASTEGQDDSFEVGSIRVANSVLDRLLNERKLELLRDPSILLLLASANNRNSGLREGSSPNVVALPIGLETKHNN